ncbi:MAG: ATP-binding cassette domain-containing protein [Deltaproteobacteria bacterium]|nr:ATP-binding cassette domain-containing protein [Deltaproteobacteria bacterium]
MISVEGVHKSFGRQIVLDGVSLQVQPHEILAVVGPSGVGKSVLLKLIMGILQPDRGCITIKGESICEACSEGRRNKIRACCGVLFQSAALFDSLTVFDNIAFPLREEKHLPRDEVNQRVLDMLEALSLKKYAFRYPEQLSMGIRKRVGMARALVREPEIFLFDEPNTGLDPMDGQEVYELINDCRKKWKFAGLVISHEIPEVFQVSDRVAMLWNGKVVEEGPPAQLIKSTNPIVQQFLKGKTDGPIRIQ